MKAILMAGGKGTRISSIDSNIPKSMIQIGGKPVLEREIECLRSQGFVDLIITVCHLGQAIMDYFGDGSKFGVRIEYFVEDKPLGNAGALFRLKDKLTEDFLLLNADVVFAVDLNRFVAFHRRHGGWATLFTHPNSHPYDSGLIVADAHQNVVAWLTKEDERPTWYRNRVNAGLHVISPKLLQREFDMPKVDLDRHLLKPLAGTGKMFCYDSPEYVKDMGTPDRFAAVSKDYLNSVISAKSLKQKQKAIFMDRDGTINKYVGFLRSIDDFELLPGAAEAIRKCNASEFLTVVVTNQPVIARGEVSYAQLQDIHNKMETLLGLEGAYLDAIYFCPHHPHNGFENEIKELKITCDCRKPKPGMLLEAAKDYNIDLQQSWMIGDGENDLLAGEAAGCKCARVDESSSLLDAVLNILEG